MVGGRVLAQPSPIVEVPLSKGRRLRCHIEGTRWVIQMQRFRQGAKAQGRFYEGRGVVLSMAVKEAAGSELSPAEQADVCRYLGSEFYRLAESGR